MNIIMFLGEDMSGEVFLVTALHDNDLNAGLRIVESSGHCFIPP